MGTREIKLQNTLTKKKEVFKGKTPEQVNIYSCGPTVYGYTHVGNARAMLTPDLISKIFRLAGYQVRYVSNITDIDDKIIKAANDRKTTASAIAQEYEAAFLEELKELSIEEPEQRPRATEHLEEMFKMIQSLIEKNFAYEAATPFGKDVYFRVKEFKAYGKLSHRKLDDMLAGARVEPGEMKENPLDFVLWKAAKPNEPEWDSPWGKGRPGWHIECSAMVSSHFPKGIDIHMGGLDLTFPHHENEIAQSEAHHGEEFAKYWLHCGMLTVEREKMSKSIGNVFKTRDFLAHFGPELFRLFILQHHYRSPIDFSEEGLLRSEALLEKLYHAKEKALSAQGSAYDLTELPAELKNLKTDVEEALFDDFNSAKALGFILKAQRICFRENKKEYWAAWSISLDYLNNIFGLVQKEVSEGIQCLKQLRFKRFGMSEDFCREVEKLIADRESYRKNKDFAKADEMRQAIEKKGVVIMDGPDGTAWSVSSKVE